jgi:serine protease Do
MKKRERLYLGIALATTAVVFFLLGMGSSPDRGGAEGPSPTATVVVKDEGGFMNLISEVANAVTPAVVHIDVSGTVVQTAPDFPNDPFFRYFFGPQGEREYKVPVQALGSGVIVSKDGYIITNNHVVQNADTINVTLYDGTDHKAKIVGRDPNTDLAVLKIDPEPGMKYAELGDSDQCRVGEWVIAIGSPRGLDWTVTAGIISAKNRQNIGVLGPTGYEDFIQTDASINPGNSGGPLINMKGKVIGINALIVSGSQGSEGLGFAIPSNMAKNISDSLVKHGKVVRGYLGVNIQELTPEMAKSLKLPKNFKGIIVADVVPDGPAVKGGIEQGDIITDINGSRVETVTQFRNLIAQTPPGSQVRIDLLRNRKEMTLSVKVGELESERKVAKAESDQDLLGVKVEKVTQEMASRIGLRKPAGVVITQVVPDSAAEKAQLAEGDIVFRVGNRQVNAPDEFYSATAEAAKEGEVMLLLRDGRSGRVGYVVVPLE